MYGSIHVLPVEDSNWLPDQQLACSLVSFFGASKVKILSGYKNTPHWNTQPKAVTSVYDIEVESAFEIASDRRLKCTIWHLDCELWSRTLWESLRGYEHLTHDHFAPSSVSLWFGPGSIPNAEHTTTVAHFSFQIEIHGDGMPKNFTEYLGVASQNPHIISLLRFLEEKSGKQWFLLVSASY